MTDIYSPKQIEVLRFALNHDFYMLINHGAKRSGKTIVDNDLFLHELKRVRKIADADGVKTPQYILAGADLSSIQRNILVEIQNKYNLELKFDKANRFKLFGVLVCCFGHSKINDLGRVRGMTAYGAYINEATISNREVFMEIKARCSATGARLIMDTNTDRPSHWLKTDFIDKADGKVIKDFSWSLDDNSFLSDRYKANVKASTPSGMFYDRDIRGAWVSASGIVYPDFNPSIHYISIDQVPPIKRFFCGVDFGYEHYGAMVLIGVGYDGIYYLLKEYSAKHRSQKDWNAIAFRIMDKIGLINFYCDSARPDLIAEMRLDGIMAINARKDVVAGIGMVAGLLKQGRLKVVKENTNRFAQEIDRYAWNKNADEPIKEDDDVMDALRYAIYTDSFLGGE